MLKQHGPLKIADACEIVRQAAVGLDEAHHCDMVHRDIKPSNLMLARARVGQPVVKILDMGLALLASAGDGRELTSTGQVMGTMDYMSPEQCDDSHAVDIRLDIYSLGATLFKLVSGRAPFDDQKTRSPIKKLMAVATKPPPLLSAVREDAPRELVELTQRLLAKQAADRPQTPESLVGLITPFAQGHNLSALLDSNSPAPTLQPTQSIASFDVATDVAADPVSQSAPPKDSVAQFNPVSQLEPIAELEPTAQGAINHETVASRKPPNRNLLVALGMMASMLLVAGIAFVLKTDDGSTIRYEIDDPSIQMSFDDQMVTVIDSGKKYEVTPGITRTQCEGR